MPYPELPAMQTLRPGLVSSLGFRFNPSPFKDALLMECYLKVCCAHLQQFNSQSLIGFKSLIVHFPHWFCKHSCEFASSRHAVVAERVSVAAIWQLDILLQHLSKSNVITCWCVAQRLDIDSRRATVVRECTSCIGRLVKQALKRLVTNGGTATLPSCVGLAAYSSGQTDPW